MLRIVAVILIVFLALVLLSWSGLGAAFGGWYGGPWGFPLLGVVVLVALIVWVAKGAPMP